MIVGGNEEKNILIFYSMSRFVLMYKWFSLDFYFPQRVKLFEEMQKVLSCNLVVAWSKPTSQEVCDIKSFPGRIVMILIEQNLTGKDFDFYYH